MSALLIRAALESALAAMSPPLPTAWENTPYTPTAGAPYQRVHMLLARPAMLEMAQRIHREQGFLQVTLCYPLNAGPSAAAARAELIRSTFHAGRTFAASGVTVSIDGTPSIHPAATEDDAYVLPVRINFYAHVQRS